MLKFTNIRVNMAGNRSEGFTIPELLIATSVFSVVLTATMAIFFIIGNLFFRGISITQTQQAAKKILDSVTADIGNAPSGFNTRIYNSGSSAHWICVGSDVRYTFYKNTEVDLSNETSPYSNGKFGLLRDTPAPPASCGAATDPCPIAGSCAFTSPNELLGSKTRLTTFEINKVSDNLWDLNIQLAYGDDEVLDGLPDSPSCKPGLKFSQFCSVTTLSTTVSRILK